MKILLPFLALIAASTGSAEQKVTFETSVRYHEEVAGHSITLVMHQRPYDFSKHEVTGGVNDEGPAKIDGVEIGGTDGTSPKSRENWPMLKAVVSIELEWDGNRIPVPAILHLNLLSLVLDRHSIQFVPRPSGKELLIQMSGGDGGGAYGASLVLRKDGNHQQYLYTHESGELPAPPYEIIEYIGTDEDGRNIVKTFNWLDSPEDQTGSGQAATRPTSKSNGGDKPQPESEERSR